MLTIERLSNLTRNKRICTLCNVEIPKDTLFVRDSYSQLAHLFCLITFLQAAPAKCSKCGEELISMFSYEYEEIMSGKILCQNCERDNNN